MKGQMTVMQGMLMRMDAHVRGFTAEMRDWRQSRADDHRRQRESSRGAAMNEHTPQTIAEQMALVVNEVATMKGAVSFMRLEFRVAIWKTGLTGSGHS